MVEISDIKSSLATGAIGENIVLTELLWHGWAPVNLNSIVRQAPNVDILAAKGRKQVAIQVKTAGLNSQSMLQLGYKKGTSVFNSKEGPIADYIAFVRLISFKTHECYIVPVEEAERVALETASDWSSTPRRNGEPRDPNFPMCIRFAPNKNRPDVSNYVEKWRRFRDAWDIIGG